MTCASFMTLSVHHVNNSATLTKPPDKCSISPQKYSMPSATGPATGPPQQIHLLVLETDTPLPKVSKERGSFADIFHDLFAKAGKSLKPPVEVQTSSYYVVGDEAEYPASLDGVNAILLTGSKYDAHGNDPWIHKLISFTRGTVTLFL